MTYVHGYDEAEAQRLQDQATSLVELLLGDTAYDAGAYVLEAGCGTGAQTVTLAAHSPDARFTSIDHSMSSLALAEAAVASKGLLNVEFKNADIYNLPFPENSFDHVFVCFVLEHLRHPIDALRALRKVLRPNGTMTVIEGDHGSTYFHPDSVSAHKAIDCQIALQSQAGGDANIGRRLFPLLTEAGFASPRVSPRMVYVDGSKPELIDSFTLKTFTAMIEGVRANALAAGLMTADEFDRGITDLCRTAESDGVFCYTFFKAVAVAN